METIRLAMLILSPVVQHLVKSLNGDHRIKHQASGIRKRIGGLSGGACRQGRGTIGPGGGGWLSIAITRRVRHFEIR